MKIFFTTLTVLIVTCIILFSGINFRNIQGNSSQALQSYDSIHWGVLQGGRVVTKELREFLAQTAYITEIGDSLLLASWSDNQPLTPPITFSPEDEIITQGYSGYLFHSFSPKKQYTVQMDYGDIDLVGMGTWGILTTPSSTSIHAISGILTFDNGTYSQSLLPGDQLIITNETIIQEKTSKDIIQSIFSANNNPLDDVVWQWFASEISHQYTLLEHEYSAWKKKESISDVDPSFLPSDFLFFNTRKASLAQAQDIFGDLQQVITSEQCATQKCSIEHIIENFQDLFSRDPTVGKEVLHLIESYYQRYTIYKMKTGIMLQEGIFDSIMLQLSKQRSSLATQLEPLSIAYNYQMWIDPDFNTQKILDRTLSQISIDELSSSEAESLWRFIRGHIENAQSVSGYSLKIVHMYMELGQSVIQYQPDLELEILESSLYVLSQIQTQIETSYFTKEGILYLVKPELVADETQELDFDIIGDFQKLFPTLEAFFSQEGRNISLDVDKERELTKILARLRWFGCIFSNNPEYLKSPRVCRGRLDS